MVVGAALKTRGWEAPTENQKWLATYANNYETPGIPISKISNFEEIPQFLGDFRVLKNQVKP